MSESEDRMIEILRILNEQEKPTGSKLIADELKNKGFNKEELYIYDSDWRSNYMFRIVYNDLNFKSSIFHKTILKEPIAYVSKYFKFPDDNEYWENTNLSDILKRWKEHKISTYTLIMYLNISNEYLFKLQQSLYLIFSIIPKNLFFVLK